MEMSHRGKEFISIADKAEADLRALLAIPANYKVLFLQGGAIAENAIVPMNLLGGRSVADYVNTGEWSKKSIKEAKKYCTVNIAASAEDKQFTYVPEQKIWKLSKDAAYVHICTNETIGGVEYQWAPDTGELPVVADMMDHQTKGGESKIVAHCTYPLTGVNCVDRIYTDLAVIDVTPQGLAVVEIVDGLAFDELVRITGVPLRRASAPSPGNAPSSN